jgi:hypothetical protein
MASEWVATNFLLMLSNLTSELLCHSGDDARLTPVAARAKRGSILASRGDDS